MDFLGIGPLELVLIFLIAIIIMGKDEALRAGKALGKLILQIRTSPFWRGLKNAVASLRTLPDDFARQAGIEELSKKISESTNLNNLTELPPDLAEEIGMDAWRRQPSDAENPLYVPPPPPKETEHPDSEEDQDE